MARPCQRVSPQIRYRSKLWTAIGTVDSEDFVDSKDTVDTEGTGASGSAAEALLAAQVQFRLVQLLDIHVLEGEHPHVLDEPSGPVHVPHPGVPHVHLEVHLAVGIARRH